MSKSKKKNAVSFTKPEEPAFLRRIKEQIGFKEGPSVDTKREDMPVCESEDLQDRDDERPTVVVLKSGDITQEEAEKLNAFADEEDEHDPGGKILYKQPPKRSAEELQVQGKKPKKEIISTAKKVKNKSLLSFDDEEDDDEGDDD